MSEHIKLQLKHHKNNNAQKQAFAKGISMKVTRAGSVTMYHVAFT